MRVGTAHHIPFVLKYLHPLVPLTQLTQLLCPGSYHPQDLRLLH